MIRRLTMTRISYDGGQTWIMQPQRLEQVTQRVEYPPLGLTRYPLIFWPFLVPCVVVGWTVGLLLGLLIRLCCWGFRRRPQPVVIRRVILEEEQ